MRQSEKHGDLLNADRKLFYNWLSEILINGITDITMRVTANKR